MECCLKNVFYPQTSYLQMSQVSKVLHAAEGQQKQSKQHAELLKSAAYAAQSLAGQ